MPRKIIRRRCGCGISPTGSGVRRAGMGRKKKGGSMRHRAAQINKLKTILTTASNQPNTAKNRASATKKLKDWAQSAHKFASKYGLYSKGKNLVGSYLQYRSNKGSSNRIGYSAPNRIAYHPSMDVN